MVTTQDFKMFQKQIQMNLECPAQSIKNNKKLWF